ncbi:LPS export ABC transporter periplasmic protein LptC [Candidatus Pelagibacter sp.]|nr:LPS export ABC transporter periplasmic protein LptC [Candidatus Pelagibacter sp.]
MNKRIIFQIFILFIIVLFTSLLFYQYSLNEASKTNNSSKDIIYSNSDENSSNIINNIEYKSFDAVGNEYKIFAKLGTISDKNPNLIIMENVNAEIILNNDEKIFINALFATYDVFNYDTIFKDEVDIEYTEHHINCNNAYLFFKDHKIKLYDNVNYISLNTSLMADEVEIDLLTKNLRVYMTNKDKKVKAIYQNNVTN